MIPWISHVGLFTILVQLDSEQKKGGQYIHNIPGAMVFGEAAPEQTWVEGAEASQLVDVFLDGGWTNQAKDHR